MCKNETYNEDIISLIKGGYKIYLDKKCEGGINRHVFYKTLNDKGHHFYHIRYTISDNKRPANYFQMLIYSKLS